MRVKKCESRLGKLLDLIEAMDNVPQPVLERLRVREEQHAQLRSQL